MQHKIANHSGRSRELFTEDSVRKEAVLAASLDGAMDGKLHMLM